MLFMNKHHKVSFSYHFIFDIIMCILVTFYERGHFVMLIIKSMHLINQLFWTYLVKSSVAMDTLCKAKNNACRLTITSIGLSINFMQFMLNEI